MVSMIRFGHFSPDAPAVDVHIDGETVFENLRYEEVTEFIEFTDGSYLIEVKSKNNETNVVEIEVELLDEIAHTAIISGLVEENDIGAFIIEDRY